MSIYCRWVIVFQAVLKVSYITVYPSRDLYVRINSVLEMAHKMASESEKENVAPSPTKKLWLSLSLKKEQKKEDEDVMKKRFPLLPTETIEDTKKQIIPRNTDKLTKWAFRLFHSWCKQRNERSNDKVPDNILLTDNHEELCHWLCVCVSEMRKEDGSDYTPRSISMFMAGLQRFIFLNEKNSQVKFVDPRSSTF